MYKRILVPTDGTDITDKAIQTAISLAKALDAQLFAISVKEPFPYSAISEMQPAPPVEFFEAQDRMANSRVQQVDAAAQLAGLPCEVHTVESLHPWEAIVAYAKDQQCDLIVMASHGRGGLASLLMGSETQKVLENSTVPLLIVR